MSKLYGAKIAGIGKCLPAKKLTNADLEKMVDTSDEWITSRTGIKERYVISGDESVSGMAVEAARTALDQAGVKPEEVDMIVTGTFTADLPLPAAACLIQDKLGAVNAGAFDIHAGCTGFLYTLIVGSQLVKAGGVKNVLVIGADACSRAIDWEDRNVCVLFGDGAAAVLLQQTEDVTDGVLSYFTGTRGSGYTSLMISAGGSSNPLTPEAVMNKEHLVQMRGREVYKFAINALVDSSRAVLEREGVTADQVSLMVPHQANLRIIEAAARKLGFKEEQVFTNIDRYGNTVAASVGIALEEAYTTGQMKSGDKVLLVGFGAGLSWAAMLLNWSL
jgi:3-oxoacyl-[acyl-carrier-protein] synthase-3